MIELTSAYKRTSSSSSETCFKPKVSSSFFAVFFNPNSCSAVLLVWGEETLATAGVSETEVLAATAVVATAVASVEVLASVDVVGTAAGS
ncbi:hypothetical protein [Shewanella sp. TC10]|uniref:hypothetical protein n=1 Tax=Shewanella sp. TC10 TaxID=1419739 RepID=UPI00129EDA24|nr:hypothetical protein [Shewanella sp. TC10]